MEVLQSRPEILAILAETASRRQIADYDIVSVETNAKGEGYLGEIFIVGLRSSDKSELHMVIKAAFTNAKIRDMAPIRMAFENEIYFYSTLFPVLKQFGLDHEQNWVEKLAPHAFHTDADNEPEVLVVENLKPAGFEVFDKRKALSHDHFALIFATYGRFHALSMALKDQQPDRFYDICEPVKEGLYESLVDKDFTAKFFHDMALIGRNSLIPGKDDAVLEKFDESFETVEKLLVRWRESLESKCEYHALLHGDCWSNNMMFKYEPEGSSRKPVDMRLIDFQIIKLGSPACDLSYCFYSGASEDTIANFNFYLDTYYSNFCKTAKALGSDPEKLLPFSALLESWKKFAKFGLLMTFQILKMKMTEQTELLDLTDMVDAEDMEAFADTYSKVKFKEAEYNERMRAILLHMYELEAL